MRILIPWIGSWLDKGEAAMSISMAKILRSKIPNVNITLSASSFKVQDIDRIRYEEYDLRVLPGIIAGIYSIIFKLDFLKFRLFKAFAVFISLIILMGKNIIWLVIYKTFNKDLKFLISDNRNIVKEYKDANFIIFCGGNIPNSGLELIIFLYEIFFCKLFRKPIMLYAQSLGPFKKEYTWPVIRIILNKVDLITTREWISKKNLDNIGVTAPKFVTADAAFVLPTIQKKDAIALLEKEAGISESELLIGVTVIQWDFPNYKDTASAKYENYLNAVAEAVDYIIETLNAIVIFFPQVIIPPKKDDRLASRKLFNKVKNKSKMKVLTTDFAPEQLKGMYGCMDLLIGSRFHSCILAQSMNVPTIAIEYEGHKAIGIMKLLDLEEYVCDINTITSNKLISKIDSIWTNRDEVKKKIREGIKVMKARCMENVRLAEKYLGPFESELFENHKKDDIC